MYKIKNEKEVANLLGDLLHPLDREAVLRGLGDLLQAKSHRLKRLLGSVNGIKDTSIRTT